MTLRLLSVLILPFALGLAAEPVAGQSAHPSAESVLPAAPVLYDVDRPSAEFHRGRRAAVLQALADDAVAIVLSSPPRQRSNDVDHQYRQSSDLYYLTGMTEPGTVLLLVPGGTTVDGSVVQEILVVPERDPSREAWSGRRLGAEGAMSELGVEVAVGSSRFSEIVDPLLETHRAYLLAWPDGLAEGSEIGAQVAYLQDRVPTLAIAPGRAGFVQRAMLRVDSEATYARMRGMMGSLRDPGDLGEEAADMVRAFLEAGNADAWLAWKEENLAGYADQTTLESILVDLREVKTEEELRFLQRAIDITTAAHREAFRSIEPGLHEYEIEAVIEYVFHREGAEHEGFPSIVGSGENSVILHYESNRRRMEDGDVVVMDIGAEYRGYSADVTRTAPVSGHFSREQRLIYEAVLEAQEAAIAAAVAGASFRDPNVAASAVLADRLTELGIISAPGEISRFMPHGVSHYLGLDVHDVGTYGPLRPGNVITVEPGIYVPPMEGVDEKWWNIGVRIEDDVLITEAGPVVLSTAAPRTPNEIESMMAEAGLASMNVGR
jgi:Xaa-Pro aminopeptidase